MKVRRFTKSEDRRLVNMWRRGTTGREIAQLLNRTTPVIHARLYYLRHNKGIALPSHGTGPHPHGWQPMEDSVLREMWTDAHTMQDIASRLGRSIASVWQRARALRLGRKTRHRIDWAERRLTMISFLLEHGYSRSDLSALLGVSRQRASQLAIKVNNRVTVSGTNGNE